MKVTAKVKVTGKVTAKTPVNRVFGRLLLPCYFHFIYIIKIERIENVYTRIRSNTPNPRTYTREVSGKVTGGKTVRESQIEARLVQGVKARGGLCLKFTSPGTPGVPDRIVITPTGRICFVELKTEIGRLANIQKWMIGEMQKRGAEVRVVKGVAEVKEFLEEVLPHEV